MSDERLHAWFDGELPPDEAAALARAADPAGGDPRTVRAAEDLRAVDGLLDVLEGAAAPAGFTGRVLAAARVDAAIDLLPSAGASPGFTERVVAAAQRSRRGRLLRFALPFAAAAAGLALYLLSPGSDAPPEVDREAVEYRWETDTETFDSLSLTDLRDAVLEELDAT